jgi:UTP:GlnB (protein PII) uridylyltransferase
MRFNKGLILPAAVAVFTLGAVATMSTVMAATSSTNSDSLAGKIAQKFNLNQSDVQSVIDQNKTDHQAARQQKIEDKLTQAVKDGKITNDQKDKILAKLQELQAERQANRDSLKDLTPAERKAKLEAKRAELKQWAKDNNIPDQFLRLLAGHPGPRNF